MSNRLRFTATSALALALLPATGLAQDDNGRIDPESAPRPVGSAIRAQGKITIDGRLDEGAWSAAEPMAHFIQSVPEAGYPATEPTAVRILYDDEMLYIGAMCYESHPERLVVKTLEWDLPGISTHEIDAFNVYIDTFLDRRNAFMFIVNPAGAYRDGQAFNDSRNLDFGWDAIVHVRTEVGDSGWTVEMGIPWTSLRFDPTREEQVWGLNLFRRSMWKLEDSFWAPMDRRDRGHRMSKAGTLTGLPTVRAGRNLALRPFVLAGSGSGRDIADVDRGRTIDGGFDLKYGLNPRLTLDLTYRTDFSQAEVDREQVNLNRFPLFFPEQRDFFLENSGMFQFGDLTERGYRTGSSLREFTLFHSRRVGLSNGRPVPLVGGVRLTGSERGFELGVFDVQTESFGDEPPENFSAVRVRRNLLGVSDVGFMFANRVATDGTAGDHYNRSFGVDANVATLGHLIVNSYFAFTQSPGRDGNSTAARVNVGWRDRLWDVGGFVQQIGGDFDPGLGFVRRTDIRHFYGTVGAHPRPPVSFLLDVNPYVEMQYITDLDGLLETRASNAGLGVAFSDGGTLDLEFSDRFERVESPFQVGTGGTIPVGSYSFREASARYEANPARTLSGGLALSGGGYFGGTRRSVGANIGWSPGYRFSTELSASHNDLDVRGQSFNANLYSGLFKYAHSTKLYGGFLVQYNAATEEVVSSVRMTLIHAPLSNLYLAYTERRDVGDAPAVAERVFTAKLTKYLQF